MQEITRAEFIEKITAFNGWTAYHNGAYDGERFKATIKGDSLVWSNGAKMELTESAVYYTNDAGALAIHQAGGRVKKEYKPVFIKRPGV